MSPNVDLPTRWEYWTTTDLGQDGAGWPRLVQLWSEFTPAGQLPGENRAGLSIGTRASLFAAATGTMVLVLRNDCEYLVTDGAQDTRTKWVEVR